MSATLGHRGGIGFGRGGGLYNTAGTVTVEDSTFLGNLARGGSNNTRSGPLVGLAGGAGIFNADGATLNLTGSSVTGNRALGGSGNTSTGGNGHVGNAFGGGLNNVGTATLTNCLFADNEARGGGGNRGDGATSQFVGTGTGGAISTSAQNTSGLPASLTQELDMSPDISYIATSALISLLLRKGHRPEKWLEVGRC